MDYEFFVYRIGQLDEDVCKQAAGTVRSQDAFVATTPNFRKHGGFHSIHSSQKIEAMDVLAKQLAAQVAHLFPLRALHEYDVNVLEPGCSLPEHTDMMGPQNIGWQCNRGHKVHFVLEGEGSWTAHRRSKETAAREFNFAVGGIYIYNNYVFHRAWNAGPDWRTHFVLMYADHQWKTKQALYKQIGIKNPSF